MGGSFLDNGYRGSYEFSPREEYRIHFRGGQYTEYIFAGPQMPDILTATPSSPGGRHPPRCGRWDTTSAVGPSTPRTRSSNSPHEHRGDDVPCDTLWLDIEYMDGFRVFTWNTEPFPDVPGDAGTAGGTGLPGDHDHRSRGEVRPRLCGVRRRAGAGRPLPDRGRRHLSRPGVAGQHRLPRLRHRRGPRLVGRTERRPCAVGSGRHLERHERAGDRQHPARPDAVRPRRVLPRALPQPVRLADGDGTTAGLREAMPDLRTFVLSRAGFAGIQRYAANWMGDNLSRWDHLWVSMPMGAGLGLSGQAFVGADIGGFAGNTHPELFLRWMQYGVLTPFCRNHSEIGNVDQYAWSFGDVIGEHVREAIKLRYRLLPYLYTCFLPAAETGAPVQRPLVFDYQYDGTVRDIDDEYLLGPDLLVAPVVKAWHDGAPGLPPRRRLVRLAHRRAGRRTGFVVAATPMETIPIYARGGAVIPMWVEAPASTSGYPPRSSSCTCSCRAPTARPLDAAGGRRAELRGARRGPVSDRLRGGAERAHRRVAGRW